MLHGKCDWHQLSYRAFAFPIVWASLLAAAFAQIAAPTDLRVDVSDGFTGRLFVSWNPPGSGTYTYNLYRSTSLSSGYTQVSYCSNSQAASKSNPEYALGLPGNGGIVLCRDDGGVLAGVGSALIPGTSYYYMVQACTSSTDCGDFTSIASAITNQNTNTPIQTNCPNSTCLPTMQGTNKNWTYTIGTPAGGSVATNLTMPYPSGQDCFECTDDQFWGYHNTTAYDPNPAMNVLAVNIPGSGSVCGGGGNLGWVAENLGFDYICVNYQNDDQEDTCAEGNLVSYYSSNMPAAIAGCFDNVSQAKLNYTSGCNIQNSPYCSDCTQQTGEPDCGSENGSQYYVATQYDAVVQRLTLMLYYLSCTDTNQGNYNVSWLNYLTVTAPGVSCNWSNGYPPATVLQYYAPNWSSIIMMGWSQGGAMSTIAAYEYPLLRAINLSAPANGMNAATNSHMPTDVIPAFFYWGFNQSATSWLAFQALSATGVPPSSQTSVREIYGLVSSNDTLVNPNQTIRYTPPPSNYNIADYNGVFQAAWNAMGFDDAGNPNNNDLAVDLNCNANNQDFCYGQPLQALTFSGTASHNFTNHALINGPGGGHNDPLYIWNEDIYEYMLLNAGAAQMTMPRPGTALTSTTVTFDWSAGTNATGYWVDIGSTPGAHDIYSSGNLGTAQTVTVNGLPSNGNMIYVTLYSLIGGGWISNGYTYTAFNPSAGAATMSSPANNSTLTSSSVTFSWNAATNSPQAYWLDVGTSTQANYYYSSGSLSTSTLSETVNSIPTNGSTIYVTLYTETGGVWVNNVYTYQTFSASAGAATISSPANNSTLTGSSVTFSWNAATDSPQAYWLDVGTSTQANYYYSSGSLSTSTLSETVNSIPTNGSTIYVTLYTETGGVWVSNVYTYTTYNPGAGGSPAVITNPSPGATLTGSSQTFNWTTGTGATAYWLDVGNTPNGQQYQTGNLGTAQMVTVNGLPQDGSTIYATLYSLIGGVWESNSYTYTAYNLSGVQLAVMQTPVPGSTLSGYQVTFTWSAGSGATAYWVDVSAVGPGGNDLDQSGNLGTAQSYTIYNLPATNPASEIWVTLYSLVGGVWESNGYIYYSGP